jgi:two-component system response regulator PilR (NtrC family)
MSVTSSATKKVTRPILGKSKAVEELDKLISKVAPTKTSVLIVGESGTGKELVARKIHETSHVSEANFVPINCGAIPENLIESELFGHKKGSFTGAVGDKLGLFEVASGGTLFLDEVGELPLPMQVKLLRALQERVIRRVGANEDIKIDVRIIAATNRDLEQAVAKGTFREDLYYRLNVIMIRTPPLRERRDDIPILAQHFLERFNSKYKRTIQGITPEAMTCLIHYAWPGNIRELENNLDRAVTLEPSEWIQPTAFSQAIQDAAKLAAETASRLAIATTDTSSPLPAGTALTAGQEIRLPAPDFSHGPLKLEEILERVQTVYVEAALKATGGDRKKAAELLGITLRSLRYRGGSSS